MSILCRWNVKGVFEKFAEYGVMIDGQQICDFLLMML